MSFKDSYQLREDGVYAFRGRFRDQDWWEPLFLGAPAITEKVYNLMEMVYNEGEHDGRSHVRKGVIHALGLDL